MEERTQSHYGLMAEFEQPEQLLDAAKRTHEAGYRKIDAYSPFPIHGLAPAIGFARTNLPIGTFICGLLGRSAAIRCSTGSTPSTTRSTSAGGPITAASCSFPSPSR